MSRIGKKPIALPSGVKFSVQNNVISVEGPKGKLQYCLLEGIKVEVKDNVVTVSRSGDSKQERAIHGLSRALINNMIMGASVGFIKHMEVVGVGFKAAVAGKQLTMQLGFTHPINFNIPDGITVETPKTDRIVVKGADRQKVGQAAADIRKFFKPEPFKGKGIRYAGEYVRRKAGKAVTTSGAK